MRYVNLLAMLLLAPIAGYSQSHDTTGGSNHVWVERGGTSFQKYLELPLGPVHFGRVDSVGCVYYDTLTGSLMVNNGSAWVPASSGGGAVNTVFGRAGNVVAQAGDYAAYYQSLLGYTAENAANKATDFTVLNNTKYPTTAAVNTQLNTALGAYYPASNPSGYITASGTAALTNKWWLPRVGSTASSATPTINTDSYDEYDITAQAADISTFSTNLAGTPVNGQILVIQITGTGAHTITWGSSFESGAITLPTAITTTMQGIVLKWNTATNKWRCAGLY